MSVLACERSRPAVIEPGIIIIQPCALIKDLARITDLVIEVLACYRFCIAVLVVFIYGCRSTFFIQDLLPALPVLLRLLPCFQQFPCHPLLPLSPLQPRFRLL